MESKYFPEIKRITDEQKTSGEINFAEVYKEIKSRHPDYSATHLVGLIEKGLELRLKKEEDARDYGQPFCRLGEWE